MKEHGLVYLNRRIKTLERQLTESIDEARTRDAIRAIADYAAHHAVLAEHELRLRRLLAHPSRAEN